MNFSEEPSNLEIHILLNEDTCRVLSAAVDYRMEKWPGGHPQEQQILQSVQMKLKGALLEFQFNKGDGSR